MKLIVFLFLATVALAAKSTENCVWYEECTNVGGRGKNCPSNPPHGPKLLEDAEAFKILQTYCPEFINDKGEAYTCCSPQLIKTMGTNIVLASGIFSRCRTCMNNLVKSICQFSCSPDQAKWMTGNKTVNPDDGKEYFKEMSIQISETYVNGTYDSCKGVVVPSSGMLAMDLACGSYGASRCSPQR
ncbi:NPC intracellular cholesterol transporter 1 homolog 1b-like [Ctenocephalides felis]|uniref:NPC intracellular cholesterol transporter 1 homolog 1b-like n=1 Tax=Ctenocephalides felis TaxID=7515 RepID=UPI000E6E3D6F|nr:NPC intracellular cholesterol transporter 1 homolog 1b-like [Ctenocephalides felis]